MLKTRIITSICLVVIFLASLAWLPSAGFACFVAVIITLASWEWGRLSGFSAYLPRIIYSLVCLCLVLSPYFLLADERWFQSIFMIACVWWAVALLWVQGYPSSALLWGNRWVRLSVGLLVLIPSGLALIYLHHQPQGAWLILLLVAVVATSDIGAYFSGRAFGQRKLAQKVSPGKSWEGVWGGLFACGLLTFIVASMVGLQWWVTLLAIIFPTAMISIVGDLLESMVKRHCGIKDSGYILPGHGGILDRIDGLTAAAPIFALAIILSGWQLP